MAELEPSRNSIRRHPCGEELPASGKYRLSATYGIWSGCGRGCKWHTRVLANVVVSLRGGADFGRDCCSLRSLSHAAVDRRRRKVSRSDRHNSCDHLHYWI